MSDNYRMPPGVGVIAWQGNIVVYQLRDGHEPEARILGEHQLLPLTDELRAAIAADVSPAKSAS